MGFEESKIASVKFKDFSGGLNSNRLSIEIEDRDAVDCQNVYYFDGFLRKMFGTNRINTQIGGFGSSDDITGLFEARFNDGNRYLIATTSAGIFRRNGNTWTDIEGAFGISDARHQFSMFNNELLGVNLTDNPWVWTGSGNIATLGGSPPRAKWITTFNNAVILANISVGGTAYPSRLAFSGDGTSATWDTTDDIIDFETSDGDQITGILPLRSRLVVYKRNSISLVNSLSDPDLVVDLDFKKGVGCVSGYTLAHSRIFTNGIQREVHIFMGEDGFYAFDGSEVYRLSDKIKNYIKNLNVSRFTDAVGVYYKPLDQYYCFFSASGSSINNAGVIYDSRKGGFWPLANVNANAAAIVENSSTDLDEIYIGTNDSIVYQFDEAEGGIEYTTELLTNGSMEADANWTSFGTPTTNDQSAVQTFNGSWSRRAISDAVNEGFYQDVTTVVGQVYRVWAMVYGSAGDARVAKQDTDGSNVVSGTTQSAASWARVTIDFTATATTSRIIFESVATAASTFFVDDASVRRMDIDGYWDSKWFDLGNPYDVKFLRELIVFARAESNYNVQVRVRFDFSTGTGTSGNLNLLDAGDVYGTGVYGTAVYGGETQLLDDIESLSADSFRHIQVRFRNQVAEQPFRIEKFLLSAKSLGRRFLHNAS